MTFVEEYADRIVFLLCAAMVFIPLERMVPRVKQKKLLRSGLKLDLLYMFVGMIPTMIISIVFIVIAVGILDNIVPLSAQKFVRSQPIWLQVILLMIMGDIYYYWVHRLSHRVPFLWKFHSVHHSIEDMDWIAAHRTHPVDTAITNSGAIILAILFDFSTLALFIFSIQFSWHSLLKHSNMKIGWGPLRWLYLTPTFHHWHHANVQEAYDRNFAAQLPVLDLIFGTAIMEERRSPAKYGVDDPVPATFLGSLIYPFLRQKAPFAQVNGNAAASFEN